MLPLLPIGVALATATALVKNVLDKNARNSNYAKLLNCVKELGVSVDNDGKFNPNAILPDGQPLLFNVMFERELLASLLECGANPDLCNADGTPALILAMDARLSDELVSILLKYGANPNAMDSEGSPAIFHTRSPQILQMLKKYGADMNAVDIHGKTALFNEVVIHKSTATVVPLIKLGADVNAKDNDGKSILFYVDDLATIAFLVAHGADIEATDSNGEKCKCYQSYIQQKNAPITTKSLRQAVDNNDIDSARQCLMNGANPNIWDTRVKVWSMIHLALYYQNPQMVELLVKFGADINANCDGIPPLSKAVYDKNFECFKLLLELGADIELAQCAIKYSGTPEMRQLAKQYSKRFIPFKNF